MKTRSRCRELLRIETSENVELRLNTEVVDGEGDYRLQRVVLKDRDTGGTKTVDAAGLFVLIGAQPHTDWLPSEIELWARTTSLPARI